MGHDAWRPAASSNIQNNEKSPGREAPRAFLVSSAVSRDQSGRLSRPAALRRVAELLLGLGETLAHGPATFRHLVLA